MSLAIKGISKSFKSDVVLDNVSFEVEKGRTLVLFGPSGAGKTVLLRLIAGAIEPDSGSIEINGRDMTGVEPEFRSVGMAFQNFALFPHMDAKDNIASPLTAKRQSKDAINDAVRKVAGLLKIEHVLGHKPGELSNGQKQRTALARALVGEPSILLLDDPLRNVDAKLRFEMRLEFPRLLSKQDTAVIYVTQDYKEAMALGHRIAVMNDHGIQQLGDPGEIYFSPANVEIARLFGDPVINLLDVVPEADGAKGALVKLSDRKIPIGPGFRHVIGKECILGIRPESVSFASASDKSAIPVTIEAETPLNEKTVTLTTTKRGREIIGSQPAGSKIPKSGSAGIKINTAHIHLFDRKTGNRIAAKSGRGK